MSNLPSASSQSPITTSAGSTLPRWWRQTGEPIALYGLALLALSIPFLIALGFASWQQAFRLVLALAWLSGGLLLLRLPRLLWRERSRTIALAGIGGGALLASLLVYPTGATLAGPSGLTLKAQPRISPQAFAQILQRGAGGGASPAAPFANELYDIIVGYGLDPAVALAFFAHESQFCTTGVCANQDTKNWGGQRRAFKQQRGIGLVPGASGSFARYASWPDSVRDWCELILYGYVNKGLDTVEKVVPVYAPRSDGNVPESYINTVHRMVAAWQGRAFEPVNNHIYPNNIQEALLTETFLSADMDYHANWAFHKYMLSEVQAGRPLGVPIDDSRIIVVGDTSYAVQVFALDTLYTPLAKEESETNWGDVQRMSSLLQQAPPIEPPPSSSVSSTTRP